MCARDYGYQMSAYLQFSRAQKRERYTHELSPLDALSTNAFNTLFSPSSIPSPNATMSIATLFFFSFFASLTMFFSSTGLSPFGNVFEL